MDPKTNEVSGRLYCDRAGVSNSAELRLQVRKEATPRACLL